MHESSELSAPTRNLIGVSTAVCYEKAFAAIVVNIIEIVENKRLRAAAAKDLDVDRHASRSSSLPALRSNLRGDSHDNGI
ncbi:hypothetical protein CVT25_007236 [Psilocybe cyanescens]|uniref:Uncharacterized protein n=1 Tax=Psilocybe cyanescens TaxID=93625 RepID=A0A409XVT5_PSICY|nr:hypothetical protein CVT25_007236 [Psilocybe cyanescens]